MRAPLVRHRLVTGKAQPGLHLGPVVAVVQNPPSEHPISLPPQPAEEGPLAVLGVVLPAERLVDAEQLAADDAEAAPEKAPRPVAERPNTEGFLAG